MTELSPIVSAGANDWETRRLGTSGKILSNVDVKILDPETMLQVPAGQEGAAPAPAAPHPLLLVLFAQPLSLLHLRVHLDEDDVGDLAELPVLCWVGGEGGTLEEIRGGGGSGGGGQGLDLGWGEATSA